MSKKRRRKRKAQARSALAGPRLRIAPDMVVSTAYQLFDGRGELVDTVSASEPLTYVHGYAQVLPGLEAGLEGMRRGHQLTLELPPALAFGERDEEAVLKIDRHDFSAGDRVEVGDEIMAADASGMEVAHRVVEVSDDVIVVDLNHPLAGQLVRFEVEVVDVRPASDAELDAAQVEALFPADRRLSAGNTVDELVVTEGTIVYGSHPGLEPRDQPQLVQICAKPGVGTPDEEDR